MPSSGLLWHWHAELRWRGWRSQCELAARAPWRHVSHYHWESADRQTAGMWRWWSGGGERKRAREERGREKDRSQALQHLVLAGLLYTLLCSQDNRANTQPTPTCTGGPQQHSNTTRQYVIFNNHSMVRYGLGQNVERKKEWVKLLWCSTGRKYNESLSFYVKL